MSLAAFSVFVLSDAQFVSPSSSDSGATDGPGGIAMQARAESTAHTLDGEADRITRLADVYRAERARQQAEIDAWLQTLDAPAADDPAPTETRKGIVIRRGIDETDPGGRVRRLVPRD